MGRSETIAGPLLAPLGRAEPDDVRRWLELGGLLALQRAADMEREAARTLLRVVAPELEGAGPIAVQPQPGEPPDVERMLVREMPLWIVGGALLAAIALGRRTIRIALSSLDHEERRLFRQIVPRLTHIGIGRPGGLAAGITIELAVSPLPAPRLSALAAFQLVESFRQGRPPATTLVAVRGAGVRPGVIEVPLGTTVEALLSTLAGAGERAGEGWLLAASRPPLAAGATIPAGACLILERKER